MLMQQYVEQMKIFVIEERLAKTSAGEIRKMVEDPESSWNRRGEELNKDLKREAAGLINRIHIETYRKGMK